MPTTALTRALRRPLLPLLGIACAVVLVYFNSLHNAFVFDDIDFIVHNPLIRDSGNMSAVWHYWPTRFLAMWTLALNMDWGGLNVAGYHAVNIAVHVVCAWSVWWLVMLLMDTPAMRDKPAARHARAMAFWAAMLFAVHPVQTEAVTYIYQRCASMAALFYAASLAFYCRGRLGEERGNPPGRWYAGAWVAAACGVFTKETIVTLPIMVALGEWIFFRAAGRSALVRALPFTLIMLLLPATLFLHQGAHHELVQYSRDLPADMDRAQYMTTELRVMMTYIGLLFVPVGQNLDYDYPITRYPLMDSWALIALALVIWIVSAALRERARRPLVCFGILWFFVTLIPESSVLVLNQVIFEHRLYLPMIGFVIFLVGVLFGRCTERRLLWMHVGLAACVVLLAGLTVRRNAVWHDPISLWTDCIQKSPNRARPYANRGRAYGEMGKYRLALADLDKALSLNPDFLPARYYRDMFKAMLDQETH